MLKQASKRESEGEGRRGCLPLYCVRVRSTLRNPLPNHSPIQKCAAKGAPGFKPARAFSTMGRPYIWGLGPFSVCVRAGKIVSSEKGSVLKESMSRLCVWRLPSSIC